MGLLKIQIGTQELFPSTSADPYFYSRFIVSNFFYLLFIYVFFCRSVLCNDPEITVIPPNFPTDTSKLRIEKTAITRIPSNNFHYLSNLEFLWMSFNSLSSLNVEGFRGLYSLDELRLDGNVLTSFPWESLTDMPNLRLLDLHNNKISTIPAEATMYIKNITYLDLSSNSLTTVPSEVLSMWLSVKLVAQVSDSSKRILGEGKAAMRSDTYSLTCCAR